MKPLTRKEFFMAKAAGQTVPDLEPITREEYFLNQIAESGGGGGGASITLNYSGGTYTAPVKAGELFAMCKAGAVSCFYDDGTVECCEVITSAMNRGEDGYVFSTYSLPLEAATADDYPSFSAD